MMALVPNLNFCDISLLLNIGQYCKKTGQVQPSFNSINNSELSLSICTGLNNTLWPEISNSAKDYGEVSPEITMAGTGLSSIAFTISMACKPVFFMAQTVIRHDNIRFKTFDNGITGGFFVIHRHHFFSPPRH